MTTNYKKAFGFLLILLFNISVCFAALPFTTESLYPDAKSKVKGAAKTIKEKVIKALKNTKNKLKRKKAAEKYSEDNGGFITQAIKIPGYENKKFVCQGVTTFSVEEKKYILLSYFPKPKHTIRASQLIVIDPDSKKPIARFSLYDEKDKKYTGHAGGITMAGDYIWVASGYKIRAFSKQKIINFIQNNLNPETVPEINPKSFMLPAKMLFTQHIYPVDTKASFVSFDGTHLWVGDFVKSSTKKFAGIAHHTKNPWDKKAWIAGYIVDKSGMPTSQIKYEYKVGEKTKSAYKPDKVIYCRELVQGMAVFGDHIALSISYSASNSKLAIYKSPLGKPGELKTFESLPGSPTIETYGVNDKCWLETYSMPAGSEDLDFDGKHLYLPFEGGSPNYKTKWRLMKPTIEIDDRFYQINADKLIEAIIK